MSKRTISSLGAAFVALLLAAPLAARAADEPAQTPFRIGEAAMAMPVPDDLCVPAGQTATLSQLTSAADTSNVTVADFWSCGAPEQAGRHYVLLKVPTRVLLMRFEKADALNQLEATLSGPDSPKFFGADIDRTAKQGIDKVTGTQSTVKSDFGFVRRDPDCIYLGGKVAIGFDAAKKPEGGLVGVCITVAGQKLLNVNVYDFRPGADLEGLLAKARAIALPVHPADPAN